MDKLDKKIVYELNWNSRQSYSKLGKKLKTSKQVIAYRIKNLEKEKIIQSYHAVIDWRRLGYNALRIYIKWHNISLEEETEIYQYMKKNPLFMWSIKFEGEIDLGCYVWIKEIPVFSKKWYAFLEKYKKYIFKYEIYESIEMINYPMKFLVEEPEYEEMIIGKKEKAEYDDIDYEILKQVTKNAQITIIEIAKKINLTPKAALYRLKNLERKNIILGYYALIDTAKIELEFYKIDFFLNDITQIKKMNEFAKQHKQIIYRMATIGGPDFEIEVIVRNAEEMKNIINEIRISFPNTIHHYRFHRFEYTIKQIYLPGEQ